MKGGTTVMAKTELTQFRLDDGTLDWLTDRAHRMHAMSPHVQARTEIELWRMALTTELRRLRFTLGEINCIADILNGTLLSPGMMVNLPLTWAEAEDAFSFATGQASYGTKWEIGERALLAKLRILGPAADHALHDAVSRWWEAGHDSTAEGWAAVGLRVVSMPGEEFPRGDANGPGSDGNATMGRPETG